MYWCFAAFLLTNKQIKTKNHPNINCDPFNIIAAI